MSMLRTSAMQRRDYAVKDLSSYQLPQLPKEYYWKLWIPNFYQPQISFLELRRRFGLVYEVVDNSMVMSDTAEELTAAIQKQALLLAVLRVYNIKLYDEPPAGSYLLEEAYALWKALQTKLPKLPSTYQWDIQEISDSEIAVTLHKRILRSEDTRILSKRTCLRTQDTDADSAAIANVAQEIYIERFLI